MEADMDTLIVPPDKATGCLPRRSQYGKLAACDKLEDRIEVIPRTKWRDYIRQGITLNGHVKDVLDQDAAGSCAAESATGGLMIVRAWQNQPHVLFNPWSAYWKTSGGRDNGSSIDDNLDYIREVGVLPMDVWPRSKGWRTKPPQDLLDNVAVKYRFDEFFDIGTIDEIGTALLKAMPVLCGSRGHAYYLVELLDENTARWVNSWGSSWGDNGRSTVRLSSLNFGYGLFAPRTAVDAGDT